MRTREPSRTRRPHVACLYNGLLNTARMSGGTAVDDAFERAASIAAKLTTMNEMAIDQRTTTMKRPSC